MKAIIKDILPDLKTAAIFTRRAKAGIVPAYSAIKLHENSITAYNGECGIVRTSATDWSELSLAVSGNLLVPLLENLDQTYTEVELVGISPQGGGRQLEVKAGSFKTTLPAISLDDYPPIDFSSSVEATYDTTGVDLLSLLNKASFCSASDLAQVLLASVTFYKDKLYALEAKRMYCVTSPLPNISEPLVIGTALVDVLVQLGESITGIRVSANKLMFTTAKGLIFGARYSEDKRYPIPDTKIKAVLDAGEKGSAVYDKDKLLSIIRRLMIVIDGLIQVIEVTLTKDGIVLTNAKDRSTESLACATVLPNGEDVTVSTTAHVLLAAVERFSSLAIYEKALGFKNDTELHFVARVIA